MNMHRTRIFVAPDEERRLRWSFHVLLDAETLRPITVYQDPN